MSAAVQLRPARVADAEAIAAAEAETARTQGLLNALPGEIPLAAYRQKIETLTEHSNGLYLVAEASGQMLGHLLLDPMPFQQNGHVCTLTIVVHPGSTGQGVGTALLSHAVDWARRNERLEKIELRVRAGNQRALALYRRFGFEQEGCSRKRLKYADNQYEDDLMMGLLLDATGTQREEEN